MKKTLPKPNKNLSELSKEELLQIIENLTVQNNRLNQYLFGSRTERFFGEVQGQSLIFNEAEELVETEETASASSDCEPKKSDSSNSKPRGKRKPLPEYLARVETIIDLPSEEKTCSLHGVELQKFAEERIEKLQIIPAKAFVGVDVVYKYKCPCCETKIVEAQRHPDPIPKSFASSGLLAYIATQKYVDHLPLARQEKIFERAGIDLDRTTMARWMIRCEEIARPLLGLLHDDLLNSPVIHADETTIQVLNEPNKTAESKSYMWCLARSGEQPIVFYRYYDNRSRNAARDILVDYGGIVIADAYKVYESLSSELGFTLAGCWAHARRRFWEAEKFGKKPGEKIGSNSASVALSFIRKLYEVETEVRGKDAALILEARQGRSTLILEEFHAWLLKKEAVILPKSPTGKAIQYTLREWEKLTRFSRDGRVAIDNNYIESHIKSFAVGRKNFLFAVVQAGAHASAGLYTLVESAKANGIEPFDYLNLIFKELPVAKTQEQLESLLPYNACQTYQLRPYSPK